MSPLSAHRDVGRLMERTARRGATPLVTGSPPPDSQRRARHAAFLGVTGVRGLPRLPRVSRCLPSLLNFRMNWRVVAQHEDASRRVDVQAVRLSKMPSPQWSSMLPERSNTMYGCSVRV